MMECVRACVYAVVPCFTISGGSCGSQANFAASFIYPVKSIEVRFRNFVFARVLRESNRMKKKSPLKREL